LTLEQLTSKIQELQTKINQLKTNPNPEISAQEVYLREQLKVLQEAKNRKLSSSPNSTSSKIPTGLIVGVVGGVIILIIGICLAVRKRHGKKVKGR
jgi:capsular polysaccharide biosynthesis protein